MSLICFGNGKITEPKRVYSNASSVSGIPIGFCFFKFYTLFRSICSVMSNYGWFQVSKMNLHRSIDQH